MSSFDWPRKIYYSARRLLFRSSKAGTWRQWLILSSYNERLFTSRICLLSSLRLPLPPLFRPFTFKRFGLRNRQSHIYWSLRPVTLLTLGAVLAVRTPCFFFLLSISSFLLSFGGAACSFPSSYMALIRAPSAFFRLASSTSLRFLSSSFCA